MKLQTFFLFFFLALSVTGFSQEIEISLQAQKELASSVSLIPTCGKGNEMKLPFTAFWDKKTETTKVVFKNHNADDKTVFIFPKRMFMKKELMKWRKDITFAKEVKKCQFKKTVSAGIDSKNLMNVVLIEPADSIITIESGNYCTEPSFLFMKNSGSNGDVIIPFNLYVASKKENKGNKEQKMIEYEAKFTLIIKKTETSSPSKPTETKPPTVDCKTLYKANEQLAELLLDMKNASPSTLSALKQKYETIKKSIANPDYKQCKEEYKSFESLCSKIDNRLQ